MAIDEQTWADMRHRLMRLTSEQVKSIAKDEGISIYSIDTKASSVNAIVRARRAKAIKEGGNHSHPWRMSYKGSRRTHDVDWIVTHGL